MNVTHVSAVLAIVTHHVIPKPPLPNGAFAAFGARRTWPALTSTGREEQRCDSPLDFRPAHGKTRIAGWQRPDAVQVIRKNDGRIDFKRVMLAFFAKGLSKKLNGVFGAQNWAAFVGDDRKKDRRAGAFDSAILGHARIIADGASRDAPYGLGVSQTHTS